MPELVQVPLWRDNYSYLVVEGGRAFVVDPSEADPVLARLEELGVTLEAVLSTHHHPDHVGGNQRLREATGCEVIGAAHDRDRIPALTRAVEIGERFEVAGVPVRVLDVHAHTRAHVAYVVDTPFERVIRHGHAGRPEEVARLSGRPAIFCGDTLFLAGCGRLFEGSPADMARALSVLLKEPKEALICCGHEYTRSNLAFAVHALPDDARVKERLDGLEAEMGEAKSSVPDVLEKELSTNPFVLCLDDERRRRLARRFGVADADDAAAVLGAVRAAKDAL